MSRPRELSIALQSNWSMADYGPLARQIELLGFDVLSIYSDLLYQPPIGPLTAAALATERIRLGPASLNPYTLHPVEIAGQVATLDSASMGRAYWGLSRGAWLDTLGLKPQRPITRIRETVDIVEHLMAGKQEAYEGSIFRLNEHHRLQYPVQREHVPLLIGSWGPKLLKFAGSRAAEVKIGGSANPDLVPAVREWLGTSSPCSIVMGAVTIVDPDREQARKAIRREMALYLPVVAPLDPTVQVDSELLERINDLTQRGETEAAGNLISDDLIDRFSFAGTPADILNQCEALFEAGAGRIEFGTPHGIDSHRGIELLGREVLPALRRRDQGVR